MHGFAGLGLGLIIIAIISSPIWVPAWALLKFKDELYARSEGFAKGYDTSIAIAQTALYIPLALAIIIGFPYGAITSDPAGPDMPIVEVLMWALSLIMLVTLPAALMFIWTTRNQRIA